jgi:hypothetical protein
MGPKLKPSQAAKECVRILRHCRRCERETPHEIRTADGMTCKTVTPKSFRK